MRRPAAPGSVHDRRILAKRCGGMAVAFRTAMSLTPSRFPQVLMSVGTLAAALAGSPVLANRAHAEEYPSQPSYSARQLDALRTADRALERKARNSVRTLAPEMDPLALAPLQVGMRWIVGMERVRSQQMKPAGLETQPTSYDQSRKDLGVFRYEVLDRTEPGGFEIRITPLLDSGAKVNTRAHDGYIESIQLTLDERGRQVAKTYVHVSGLDPIRREVAVSPDGLRARLTAFEAFPLDWPSGLAPAERTGLSPARGDQVEVAVSAALSELIARSSFAADSENLRGVRTLLRMRDSGGLRIQRLFEGMDFFGRPVDARYQNGFPWPVWLRNAQGIAVLLGVESSGN